jgi:uncharacterized protein YecE (DUF72 family)
MSGRIRIGVGGWTFEPWRGLFYPKDLKHKDELSYLSRALSCIEINGTYYSLQKPAVWAKWAAETPERLQFTVKGSRFATNRRVLAEAGESVGRFMAQGLEELGGKLGPVFWQFANTKQFDPEDFGAFLKLLPSTVGGLKVRHAVEVRHDSFVTPEFPALLRKHGVGLVYADHATYPEMADVTADFVYARLQTGSDDIKTAYSDGDLDLWAGRLKAWAGGGVPEGLPVADPGHAPKTEARDVFAFIIHEGKLRAPHGAQALMEKVGSSV